MPILETGKELESFVRQSVRAARQHWSHSLEVCRIEGRTGHALETKGKNAANIAVLEELLALPVEDLVAASLKRLERRSTGPEKTVDGERVLHVLGAG